ncbi:MAG: hypothetical protein UHD09_03375 [Bifidobacterium sp.]|nr:hypothetical protein [Bifidobacterium sp.]
MGYFISMLVAAYPSGDCLPENFIKHLTPGAPGFAATLVAVILAVVFGLLVYIIPIILTETEHAQPYPLWLHCFYWAADFMGIWVFLHAFLTYDHFYIFGLLSLGEAIWVAMETYCLQRAMTYERDQNWPADWSFGKRLGNIVLMTLAFFVSLNLLRVELHDPTMWKFWIFTQVLITIVPGLYLERKGSRVGNSRLLNICFICVALVSFNPWCNMWEAIAPDFFGLKANPWYYIVGVVCLFCSIRGAVLYERLPKKPAVIEATGKKPLLS